MKTEKTRATRKARATKRLERAVKANAIAQEQTTTAVSPVAPVKTDPPRRERKPRETKAVTVCIVREAYYFAGALACRVSSTFFA
jgi:hypothetical protein